MGRAVLADAQKIAERNALVESAMEAIRNVAFMVLKRFCSNIEVDDLIQQGCIGAMQAAEKFDPSRGIPFPAFAYQRIRGAMYDSVRRGNYNAIATASIEDLDRPLDVAELDPPNEADIVRDIDNQRHLLDVERAMNQLTEKQRRVVAIHYMQEKTLREAGELIGVSSPRAAQLRSEAINTLRQAIQKLRDAA